MVGCFKRNIGQRYEDEGAENLGPERPTNSYQCTDETSDGRKKSVMHIKKPLYGGRDLKDVGVSAVSKDQVYGRREYDRFQEGWRDEMRFGDDQGCVRQRMAEGNQP